MTLLSRLRAVVETGEPVSNELARDALRALEDVAVALEEIYGSAPPGSTFEAVSERILERLGVAVAPLEMR